MDFLGATYIICRALFMHREIQTDIVVLGGGCAGLWLAHDSAKRGFQCVLVEHGGRQIDGHKVHAARVARYIRYAVNNGQFKVAK